MSKPLDFWRAPGCLGLLADAIGARLAAARCRRPGGAGEGALVGDARALISARRPGRRPGFWIVWVVPLLLLGCVGVNSAADREIAAETMPRPSVILVSDFAVTPEEMSQARFASGRLVQDTTKAPTEQAVGHRFARAFTAGLIEEIRKMGLPAEPAGAPLPPGGAVLSIEGQFVSIASDNPTAPGIIGFAADWANVVADIQIYSTSKAGDRLNEDLEFDLADANQPPEHMPAAVLARLRREADDTGHPGGRLTPAIEAELDTVATATASAAAKQLETFFADQGWIGPAQIKG